jgi:ACT domain-containing protein
MRAVITVLGYDKVGIIAKVSAYLAENNINILDISQTIMQKDIFTMIMLTDISDSEIKFQKAVEDLDNMGKELGLEIRMQHEEIFNSMHEI